jgi:energy-coupling factor transport system ATP-binding protein
MIRFDRVTFTYPEAADPTLRDVELTVAEGELCLVVGQTGSGKSTLLRAINGLVPHFTGGRLVGDVSVGGRSTRDDPPRQLADVVGLVGQDPTSSFVTDVVEDELAYAMENLGVPAPAMRRRVEDTLDLLGLHDLRHRPLRALSGGQQQRVAIGAVLTTAPRVLVLDEPTSALDPAAAEEVLAALSRLVHDLGLTVVVAEHRLERVVPFADRVVLVPGNGAPLVAGPPGAVMAASPVVPPVVELGRLAGWAPLPLSIRDARREAASLRDQLRALPAPNGHWPAARPPARPAARDGHDVVAEVGHLSASYGPVVALRQVSVQLRAGEIVAVMGRNGSGKSTLLRHLVGLTPPASGRVRVLGRAPHALPARQLNRTVGLVPQDPGVLLYGETVAGECDAADRDGHLPPGTTADALAAIVPGLAADRHPRDLSEGQRLGLALAVVLGPRPPVILLDEPTRGLDYAAKHRLAATLRSLGDAGHTVVMATHDVELVAGLAERAIVLAEGEVVADGPAREVVCHSPVFAPQVAKILAPLPWLTVDEVRTALAQADGGGA